MMGHFLGASRGGMLLFQSVMLIPLLVNVALLATVNGFPAARDNNSSFPLDFESSYSDLNSISTSTPDDLELSSEELEDEDPAVDFPVIPSFRVVGHSTSHSHSDSRIPSDFSDFQHNHHSSSPLSLGKSTRSGSGHKKQPHKKRRSSPESNATREHAGVTPISHHESSSIRHGRNFNTPPASLSLRQEDTSNIKPMALEIEKEEDKHSSRRSNDGRMMHKLGDEGSPVKIIGMSVDYDSDKRRVDYDDEGCPNILEGMDVKLTLYGKFKPNTYFRFSKFHVCDDPKNEDKKYLVDIQDEDQTVGIVHVRVPLAGELNEVYLCLRHDNDPHFMRQGESKTGHFGLPIKPWLVIKLTKSMFPVYLHVFFIILLLSLSGLFSGLNLGLMSLDKTDLKIIMNTGSKSEKDYAQSIVPVRNHGNFLLCCLLFSNVLVNATLTILVDDLTSGLIAIAGSTLAIVIFGEIIPQALCSRYGLAVGARTIYITKFFMLLTSPLAYPLSKVLDKVLGEEIGNVYTRERLKELLEVTRDKHGLEPEEVGIISGALDLKLKTVKDVMVRLEAIFMLPSDAVLDFETMAEIEYQGYSRIPVYDGDRSNVVALINVKQLTLLDASDNIPLRLIMDYYKTNLFFVFENTHLDFMFKAFREGSRGHMAFVQRVNDDGPGDPYYETVGMLTMEDVLEEILQTDIRDENDIEKINARAGNPKRPLAVPFKEKKKPKKVVEIPATLILAATQYLSTSVDPFKYGTISPHIIQRLLKTNVQFVKAPKRKGRQKVPDVYLYESGKPADSFMMILEGRVNVTVGKERLMYEAGPFSAFGSDFLLNDSLGVPLPVRTINSGDSTLSSPTDVDPCERPSITSEMTDVKRRATFCPDYSVKVATDVYFLRVRYDHYRHALAATELERAYSNDPENVEVDNELQQEIEKVMDNADYENEAHDAQDKATSAGDIADKNPNILINGVLHKNPKTDKDTSTSTETDESDNTKDSDHDENNPTEVTKLLQNSVVCSKS